MDPPAPQQPQELTMEEASKKTNDKTDKDAAEKETADATNATHATSTDNDPNSKELVLTSLSGLQVNAEETMDQTEDTRGATAPLTTPHELSPTNAPPSLLDEDEEEDEEDEEESADDSGDNNEQQQDHVEDANAKEEEETRLVIESEEAADFKLMQKEGEHVFPVAEKATSIAPNNDNDSNSHDTKQPPPPPQSVSPPLDPEKLRTMEAMHIGNSEILFQPAATTTGNNNSNHHHTAGWDNLRWMSLSGRRVVSFSRVCFRRVKEQFQVLGIKSPVTIVFPARLMVIYEQPAVLLLLRRAANAAELSQYLNEQVEDDNLLSHYWIAESVVELATCQLRLSALTTHGTSEVIQKQQHAREASSWALVTPTESIVLNAVQERAANDKNSFVDSGAFMETSSTELALVQALERAHGHHSSKDDDNNDKEVDGTWRHQVILGTLHAHVLSSDSQSLLKPALERALQTVARQQQAAGQPAPTVLPSRIIDAPDAEGFPPIYYAAQQSRNQAMALLLQYGARIDYTTPILQQSLLHLCAQRRNVNGLAMLFSKPSPTTSDGTEWVNTVDAAGQTPLYVAVVSGKSPQPHALSKAMEQLVNVGGRFWATESDSNVLPHPLLALVMQHQWDDLAVLIDHLELDYPLSGHTDISRRTIGQQSSTTGQSLSALYHYPVHQMLAQWSQQVVQSEETGAINCNAVGILGTLSILLQCGFEVNERLDPTALMEMSSEERSRLGAFVGFAPLQILALIALQLEKVGPQLDESKYGELDSILSSLCQELVKCGGRLSLEPPPRERKRAKPPSPQKQTSSTVSGTDEAQEKNEAGKEPDRAGLKIDTNEHLLHLLGGKESLQKAQTMFAEGKSVMVDHAQAPHREDSSAIEDSPAPGGSSEKSCAICWKAFGTLMNRKHRCRISWRHVCDDCSTKRILVNGKEFRVSDGQYLRARANVEKQAQRQAQEQQSGILCTSVSNSEAASSANTNMNLSKARLARLEAEEQSNRDSLFGGDVMEQATNFLFGTDEDKAGEKDKEAQMNGMVSSLDATRNALLERGDKLSSLNDKSAAMVNASEDFAKLATELRKKSEGGFFW